MLVVLFHFFAIVAICRSLFLYITALPQTRHRINDAVKNIIKDSGHLSIFVTLLEWKFILPSCNDQHLPATDSLLSKANGRDIFLLAHELISNVPYSVNFCESNQFVENDKIKHQNMCLMLADQPSVNERKEHNFCNILYCFLFYKVNTKSNQSTPISFSDRVYWY